MLLHTSFRNCCRLSSREVCTTLHGVTAQQTSCLQLSAFPRLVKAVQQCTRISSRKVSSHQECFRIRYIQVIFALRSLRLCVNAVPSGSKPFSPLQRFSQWLLYNPAFSTIACGASYLGTWKTDPCNNPTRFCCLDNTDRLFRVCGDATDKAWCFDDVS